jgi:hypothetical protein
MKIKTREFNGHGNYIFFKRPIEVTTAHESDLSVINLTSAGPGIPEVSFNHSVNISNDIFNYKLVIEENTILDLSLDLNLINQSNTLNADQVLIGITDAVIDSCLKLNTVDTTYQISEYELINMFNTTYVSKDKPDSALNDGNKCPFKIFVPSKNSNPEDFVILMYGENTVKAPEFSHVFSSDTLTLDVSELVRFKHIVSDITITPSKSTIQADDTITLTVSSADTSVTEIYAEAVYGIIAKTRISLVNGVGTVVLSTLGLSAGDPIRIKFGYKFFTGVKEYTNTVT